MFAAAAVLVGLHAGVRIRQGLEPTATLPLFREFLEKHVRGRESAFARTAATPATPGGGRPPAPGDAPKSPNDPKPQVKL